MAGQLVGDRDRDQAALALRRHYTEGRLTTDELAQRLESALRARNGSQLRSVLADLPPAWRWLDLQAPRSPIRVARNAAIVVGTTVVWLFWSVGLLVAFVAWLAAEGPSLGSLLIFPLLWFTVSWLLWHAGRRWRSRR